MIKLVIMIGVPTDSDEFLENWPAFLHEAENMPGLLREVSSHVDGVIYGDFPFALIHELHFENREALQAAMNSAPGRQAGKILQTLTQGNLILFVADHKEDDSANLARYRLAGEDETPSG